MNWLQKFMMGRYGSDQLSLVLLIVSILLTLISQLTELLLLGFVAYVLLGIALFRMLSRDTAKRSMENYKFSILISPIYSWFKKTENHAKEAKTHKYYKCPECKTKLRLPKGKGKIKITCPKCNYQFMKKT
ncbi:MAG: hypothetical protein PHT78_14440 [Desulfitobacteriaceae bacterium]|nr:hypothetical protein [Desulfitobacteriaceae bacterium]